MKNTKILYFLLTLVVLLSSSTSIVSKAKESLEADDIYKDVVGNPKEFYEQYIDYELFEKQVRESLENFEEVIYFPKNTIPYSDEAFYAFWDMLDDEMSDLYYVSGSNINSSNGYLTYAKITYSATPDEVEVYNVTLESAMKNILLGIEGNDSLSDVEKLLLIHDRLAVLCQYDYTFSNYDAYDALVYKTSVCQGYAEAYSLLLDKVGIKNELCSSSQLNHAWNIVYLDGKPYHVDVTWDDPSWGGGKEAVLGYVRHTNFLRSTEGIIEAEHTANDFNSTPSDTTYDNYFWQNSESAFVLLNDEIYYIDESEGALVRYSDGAVLASIDDTWTAGGYSYWVGHYGKLVTDGENLYYSLSSGVYKYNFEKGKGELVYSPSLNGVESIYGLSYENGYIICQINESPNISSSSRYEKILVSAKDEKRDSIVVNENAFVLLDGEYAKGVPCNTTVSEVLEQIYNGNAVISDKLGRVLPLDDLCKTGDKITLVDGASIASQYEIVILGDVDGNGVVDATDYMRIKSVFLGNYSLEGSNKLAADVTADDRIDTTDYLRIKSFFLGTFDLYA
ncbi:MAG: hypothetical protein E7614_07845 [Ruminococcaceae bacterium]|nr:hypothetical protein [Oscillospiraceae bacterium]